MLNYINFKSQVGLTEFTKKCSERWKTMTEKEKRRFNQMADADKKVFKLKIYRIDMI